MAAQVALRRQQAHEDPKLLKVSTSVDHENTESDTFSTSLPSGLGMLNADANHANVERTNLPSSNSSLVSASPDGKLELSSSNLSSGISGSKNSSGKEEVRPSGSSINSPKRRKVEMNLLGGEYFF